MPILENIPGPVRGRLRSAARRHGRPAHDREARELLCRRQERAVRFPFHPACLRALGHKSWRATVCTALVCLCVPTFIYRYAHASLDAHFLTLAALALYLRSPSGEPRAGTRFRKSHCEGLVKYATDFVSTDGSVLEHARSMPAYLFLWNPRQDNASFRDFDQVCADAATGRPYETRWVCPSRKPQPGDIALLQRTGKEHNGVFARGVQALICPLSQLQRK